MVSRPILLIIWNVAPKTFRIDIYSVSKCYYKPGSPLVTNDQTFCMIVL